MIHNLETLVILYSLERAPMDEWCHK